MLRRRPAWQYDLDLDDHRQNRRGQNRARREHTRNARWVCLAFPGRKQNDGIAYICGIGRRVLGAVLVEYGSKYARRGGDYGNIRWGGTAALRLHDDIRRVVPRHFVWNHGIDLVSGEIGQRRGNTVEKHLGICGTGRKGHD